MLKNMKIGLRLALGFCLVFGFMIALIIVSLNQMKVDYTNLDQIVNEVNARVRLASNMVDNAREVALSVRGTLLLKYKNESNENVQKMKNNYAERWSVYDQNIAQMKTMMNKECAVGHQLFAKIETSADSARQLTTQAIEMAMTGKLDDATKFVFTTAYPSVQRWIQNNQNFILHSEEHVKLFYEEAHAGQKRARTAMFILGILALILAAAIAVLLTSSIIKPLKTSIQAANLIASQDLTTDPSTFEKRSDEIGELNEAFKKMLEILRSQMQEIGEGINVLSSSTSEIMATVTQLASSAAETATSVSEATSTVEEVKQTADVVNEKAEHVSESGRKTATISNSGMESIKNSIASMNRIQGQMELIATIIVKLSDQSQTINEITSSVNDLAEQSNLLAVNAAIEAAKAGEQGKGFTVVAQEIKSLAEQSKEATAQVRTILTDVQKSISSAVMATEQGNKAVKEGLELSNATDKTIQTLTDSIREAAEASYQIAASSKQQVAGMDQVAEAMEVIKTASAQSAVSTKQTEKAVTDLHDLGDNLKRLIQRYKV